MGLKLNNMKTNIQIKIFKKNTVITNYVTGFKISETFSILDFKNLIKSDIKQLPAHTIIDEVFYVGNKKLNDNDVVPISSGLEYNIFLK